MQRHFGDPAAEYRAAHDSAIVVERDDRAVLRVYGRDPVKMIQGLITNDLAGAPENRAIDAAVLTPKGRMIAEVRAVRHNGDVWLDTHADAEEALSAHLRKFVPPLFARFERAQLAVVGVYGPRAEELARAAAEDALVLETSYAGVPGFDVFVPLRRAEDAVAALAAAGAVRAGSAALETLRIEAGVPRWGAELDETVIPLEAGLRERAISETKGCYTGQEVIVRILHRGHVNRSLRGLLLGDAPTPATGATITTAEGKDVGRITSACSSPRLEQTIALGYVRREIADGSHVNVGEARATVVALPFG